MLQTFTLEFWTKFDTPSTDVEGVIQAFGVTGDTSCDIDGYGFYRYNMTLYFVIAGTNICGDNSLEVTLSPKVWTHVAVVVGNAQAQLFVNGVSQSTKPMTSSITFGSTVAPFNIGQGPDPSSGFTNGELDEIRFWNVTRAATDILNYYTQSLNEAEITSLLLAYWRFEVGNDGLVQDSSMYNQAVLVTGAMTYIADCQLTSCLCGTGVYCVPDHDLLDTSACASTAITPSTTSNSATTPTSGTTKTQTSTTQTKTERESESQMWIVSLLFLVTCIIF